MKSVTMWMVLITAALVTGTSAYAKEMFPHRASYPDVNYIVRADLEKRYENVVIVDVRSRYEYETIHVTDALNISVSKSSFASRVKDLRTRTNKTIVFYCNGHTCSKSYKATRKAQTAGVKNVVAFDAGIFDWARNNAKRSVLLGQSPINPDDLISKKDFKKRLLKAEKFQKLVEQPNVLVLDVRSRLQRAGAGLFPFFEKNAGLDNKKKLDRYIDKARREGKTLLAYDGVGKQVRWFEYYLRKKGVKKYYFMKGGANGYYKLLAKQQKGSIITKETAKLASGKK